MGMASIWSTSQHQHAGLVEKMKHKSTVYMQNTLENSHDITMLALILLKG